MNRFAISLSLAFILACGGTSLSALDARAVLNQQRACEAIANRAIDNGAIQSLAEACQCGAVGILKRAGKTFDEPAISCPGSDAADAGK